LADVVGTDVASLAVDSDDDAVITQTILDRVAAVEANVAELQEQQVEYQAAAEQDKQAGEIAGATIEVDDTLLSEAIFDQHLSFNGAVNIDDTLTVTEELNVHSDVTLYANLVVDTVHLADALNVHGDTDLLGDVRVVGELSLSNKQAGTAVVPPGGTAISVGYVEPFTDTPAVQVTPLGRVGSQWWVSDYTDEGFTINIDEITSEEIVFSWTTLGVEAPVETREGEASKPDTEDVESEVVESTTEDDAVDSLDSTDNGTTAADREDSDQRAEQLRWR
jgi:hypothetical protein